MTNLRDVVLRHATPPAAMANKTIDRDALRQDLSALQAHLRTVLWIAVGMALCIFVFEVIVAVVFLNSPSVVAAVAGAVGITVAGAIEVVRRLAADMARANLLVVLSAELTQEAIASIVNILAGQLAGTSGSGSTAKPRRGQRRGAHVPR